MAGKWKTHFANDNSIVLELACGRGEYTVGLAALHPENNYIGVDIKGNRMFIGARAAKDDKISNAAFLRTQIERIDEYFAAGEVSAIWITFPDPQLRVSKAKKRLTHPRFLRLYRKILEKNGEIHLKTDSPDLYAFTQWVAQETNSEILEECDNVNGASAIAPELKIKTHYESLDIAGSNRIHYLRFRLPEKIPDIDAALKAELSKQLL